MAIQMISQGINAVKVLLNRSHLIQPSNLSRTIFCWAPSASETTQSDGTPRYKGQWPTYGEGDPYKTKIKRRRVVKNINEPSLDVIECLKWSKWRMRRDIIRRVRQMRFHQTRYNLINIADSRILPQVVREDAVKDQLALCEGINFMQINNLCMITGRNFGKNKFNRMQRMTWRHFADQNQLSGVMRALWGDNRHTDNCNDADNSKA